ncbi:MAG: hypothetical protein AAGK67_15110 [Pseudomonadota bacterium]
MSTLSLLKLSSICMETLTRDGFEILEETPRVDLEHEASGIGKDYVTPTLSSAASDFTHTSAVWLTLRQAGELRAIMGMRYDELGEEAVSDYWKRTYRRQYGAEVSNHPANLSSILGGNLVYMGDLFFHPDIRRSLSRLMSFVNLAHCLSFTKWKSAEYIYAFHHRRDVLRGKTDQYGFGNRLPGPQVWNDGPDYRSAHEYLAVLSRPDFLHRAQYYVLNPELIQHADQFSARP